MPTYFTFRPLGICTLCVLILGITSSASARENDSEGRQAPVTASAFSPRKDHLVTGSQAGVNILTWPSLEVVTRLQTDLTNIHCINFSPDGESLLIGGGIPGESGSMELWSWQEKSRLRVRRLHEDLIYGVTWFADGELFATASADGTCVVGEMRTGRIRTTYSGHSKAVLSICGLDKDLAVSAGVDQTIRIWKIGNGLPLRTLNNHVGTVFSMAVTSDFGNDARSRMASASDDRTVRIWDPEIGRMIRFMRVDSAAKSLIWSEDSTRLLIGCADGTLRLIDTESLTPVLQIDGQCGHIHTLQWDESEGLAFVGGACGSRAVSVRNREVNENISVQND